jgi:hypothetical protein
MNLQVRIKILPVQNFAFMAKCQTPKELKEKNFDAILIQSVGVELLQIFGQIGSLKCEN